MVNRISDSTSIKGLWMTFGQPHEIAKYINHSDSNLLNEDYV